LGNGCTENQDVILLEMLGVFARFVALYVFAGFVLVCLVKICILDCFNFGYLFVCLFEYDGEFCA
jgi:hypothetical protein